MPSSRRERGDGGAYAQYDAFSKLLDRNGRWIEVADVKAGATLVFLTAVFPVLVGPALPAAQKFFREIPPQANFWQQVPADLFVALLVTFCITALYTLTHVLLTLVPQLRHDHKPGHIFFGDVAAREHLAWRRDMLARDVEMLTQDVLDQVHATAVIAAAKHKHARLAIASVFMTVLLGLTLYVISRLAS